MKKFDDCKIIEGKIIFINPDTEEPHVFSEIDYLSTLTASCVLLAIAKYRNIERWEEYVHLPILPSFGEYQAITRHGMCLPAHCNRRRYILQTYLEYLADLVNGDWKADYSYQSDQAKFYYCRVNKKIMITSCMASSFPILSFKSEEVAKRVLNHACTEIYEFYYITERR